MRMNYLALCVAVSGCAHVCPPMQVPDQVVKQVYQPERPELPAATLQPGDSPATVIRSLLMTIEVLQGYAEQLETLD